MVALTVRKRLRSALTLVPTDEPDERWHSRGVANAPARGGRAVVRRRSVVPLPVAATDDAGARA